MKFDNISVVKIEFDVYFDQKPKECFKNIVLSWYEDKLMIIINKGSHKIKF